MGAPVPEWVEVSQTLDRWFAFVDITGFTSYTEQHGTRAALDVLARFRSVVRQVTGRRGVRVLKWLRWSARSPVAAGCGSSSGWATA